jgi:hypothetical protein
MLTVHSSDLLCTKWRGYGPWVLGVNEHSFKFELSWELKFCIFCGGLWMLEASLSIIYR